MSRMSDLHATLTDRGVLPEYPDDSDYDAPDPQGIRPSDLELMEDPDATIPYHLPVIRDDRGRGRTDPPPLAPANLYAGVDFVLYSCPDCGRDHFVTVDPCPSADAATADVAMAR